MNVFVVVEKEKGDIENIYAFNSFSEAQKKAEQIKANWQTDTGALLYEVPLGSEDGSTCKFCAE